MEMNEENRMPIAMLDFEEARQLADYGAIFQDLSFVLAVLERLHDLLGEDGDDADSVLVRAYWTAALIAYVRCFSTGKRFGLSEEIFEGTEGGVEVHRLYKQLRDKHVAHSVNPFEQVKVGAVLASEGAEERKIQGIAATTFNLLSHSQEGVEQLFHLTRIARKKALEETESLKEATRAKAGTMDLDELYEKAEPLRHYAPGPDDASRSR
jgi:hypothetical protein